MTNMFFLLSRQWPWTVVHRLHVSSRTAPRVPLAFRTPPHTVPVAAWWAITLHSWGNTLFLESLFGCMESLSVPMGAYNVEHFINSINVAAANQKCSANCNNRASYYFNSHSGPPFRDSHSNRLNNHESSVGLNSLFLFPLLLAVGRSSPVWQFFSYIYIFIITKISLHAHRWHQSVTDGASFR